MQTDIICMLETVLEAPSTLPVTQWKHMAQFMGQVGVGERGELIPPFPG